MNKFSTNLDGEFELVVELWDEQIVRELLPHLHDAYDGRVNLVLPVLEYPLRCAHVLLLLQPPKQSG